MFAGFALAVVVVAGLLRLMPLAPRRRLRRCVILLGFYAAMAYLMVAGTIVVAALGQSSAPRLSQYYALGNRDAFTSLLATTVCIGFGLGLVSKAIEPFWGAVLAKIAVLVLIVLFIQKRPQGMFALKGRSAEA